MAIDDHRLRATAPARPDRDATWSDPELIEACLAGRQFAWDALIARYRTLAEYVGT